MSSLPHQRLVSEATAHGTGEVLRRIPVEYSPELELAIFQGVRQAILHYAAGLDSWSRRLPPLERGKQCA
ncbi:MAG: hypothetical protein ACRELG_07570 [Gemmataceae bacterium]